MAKVKNDDLPRILLKQKSMKKVFKNSHCEKCYGYDNLKYKEDLGYVICKNCYIKLKEIK